MYLNVGQSPVDEPSDEQPSTSETNVNIVGQSALLSGPSNAPSQNSGYFQSSSGGFHSQRQMTDFIQIKKPLSVPMKKKCDEQLTKMIIKR